VVITQMISDIHVLNFNWRVTRF